MVDTSRTEKPCRATTVVVAGIRLCSIVYGGMPHGIGATNIGMFGNHRQLSTDGKWLGQGGDRAQATGLDDDHVLNDDSVWRRQRGCFPT